MVVLTHAVLFAPAVVAVVFCFVCISNCHLPGKAGEKREGGRGCALTVVVVLAVVVHLVISNVLDQITKSLNCS